MPYMNVLVCSELACWKAYERPCEWLVGQFIRSAQQDAAQLLTAA